MDKQEYAAPELTDHGSLAELTETGLTHPGQDLKFGSRPSAGL